MRALNAILRELIAVFIDDNALALTIILWVGLIALAGRLLGPRLELAPILALGLAGILIESALRRARGGRK